MVRRVVRSCSAVTLQLCRAVMRTTSLGDGVPITLWSFEGEAIRSNCEHSLLSVGDCAALTGARACVVLTIVLSVIACISTVAVLRKAASWFGPVAIVGLALSTTTAGLGFWLGLKAMNSCKLTATAGAWPDTTIQIATVFQIFAALESGFAFFGAIYLVCSDENARFR